uniref:Uncharacterized protein n=1 Tax=Globodera rostochiensis TaxID=31243 RepID=A0A914HR27_GLORO
MFLLRNEDTTITTHLKITTTSSEQLYFLVKAEEFGDHSSFQLIAAAASAASPKRLASPVEWTLPLTNGAKNLRV